MLIKEDKFVMDFRLSVRNTFTKKGDFYQKIT
jgi:hypothetical protein